jgi:hypothetical protein
MSYYEYTATPEALEALNEWHIKTMKGYGPDDIASALATDMRALSEGRIVELPAQSTHSGTPETFSLDLEDSRYFTKTLIEEDEE